MNTINLLSALNRFVNLAKIIANSIGADVNARDAFAVSLSYNTIEVVLPNPDSASHIVQCTFEIKGDFANLTDISADSPEKQTTIRNLMLQQSEDSRFVWNTTADPTIFQPEILSCISIADTVAKEVCLFDPGDNYWPGYFTEIVLAANGITLTQINRRNARSIDHKGDYLMRELEFFIPFDPVDAKDVHSLFDDVYMIGKMQIRFSDHSSVQNRRGGELIKEKIKELKQN